MARSAALDVAMLLSRRPAIVRQWRRQPLPEGVQTVLEIVACERDTLAEAAEATGWEQIELRTAAEFFVEQIMFNHRADAYRILGVAPDASTSEMRRHMALLMKWLHPDATDENEWDAQPVDRSIFVQRVTGAWNMIKSAERRTAYDAKRNAGPIVTVPSGVKPRPADATPAAGPQPAPTTSTAQGFVWPEASSADDAAPEHDAPMRNAGRPGEHPTQALQAVHEFENVPSDRPFWFRIIMFLTGRR